LPIAGVVLYHPEFSPTLILLYTFIVYVETMEVDEDRRREADDIIVLFTYSI